MMESPKIHINSKLMILRLLVLKFVDLLFTEVDMEVIVVDSINLMEIAVAMAVKATMMDIASLLVSTIRINASRKIRPKMMFQETAIKALTIKIIL